MSFLTRLWTASDPEPPPDDRPQWRKVVGYVLTALAAVLVLFALLMPNRLSRLTTPEAFVRIPMEALLAVALLLLVRAKTVLRRVVAAVIGVSLGLLFIIKVIDIGFYESLDRPFDLVLDWVLLDDATNFLKDSVGATGARIAVILAVLLVIAVPVFMTLAVLRLSRLIARHRTASTRSVLVLGVAWVALAASGLQIVNNYPVADRKAAALTYHRAQDIRAGLADKEAFAKQAAIDNFRDTPGDQLLTGLRGKDVIFAIVESYGRGAIEDPRLAKIVDPVLAAGTQRLAAKGFASRSGFLTSPTAGGGSWLAHNTFLSGLWVDNQQRYRTATSSDRLTIPYAFRKAGYRSVSFEPDTTSFWPEGETYYKYHKVYGEDALGYKGPYFSWSRAPDQYTMAAFQQMEYGLPNRGPLFGEITLTSSHSPWAPIPRMIDWNAVGDGSVYHGIQKEGKKYTDVWSNKNSIRTEYARSVAYSVETLISYLETYGRDNLVMVFIGDHQPSPVVVGENASRDVPVTIVAKDPAVLDRTAGWGWQDGLKPGPDAPVWKMDAFRDKFLTAFGPQPQPAR